ncbi:hypothetical protein HDV05_000894 [Chytridiales sp. JEL 0842]|nr:hypothetical protein HDV05_000894 [Chytridiales sp. JEL 0842]
MSIIYLVALYEFPIIASFPGVSFQSKFVSILSTIMFGFDVAINFLIPRILEGERIESLKKSQLHYLKFGFILDIIGVLPFDIIFWRMPYSEILMILRLLMIRNVYSIMLHSPLYSKLSTMLQKTLGVGISFMSIFMLTFLLVVFMHLQACIVFMFGKFTNFEAISWRPYDFVIKQEVANQYIWSVFNSVANVYPVTGFIPSEPVEQIVTIIMILIGAILYAALVGTISSFSFGLDSSGRKFKERLDEVNEYMSYIKLNEGLRQKVAQYYDLKYQGKYFDEAAIFAEMNDSLRREIAIHNCKDLIDKVPFLRRELKDGRDDVFVGRIAQALQATHFVKGDTIFEQGWVGNEMYFIQRGKVAIIVNGNQVATLSDGAFFGEVALLGDMPRTATIRAIANTVLYRFGRSDFANILADFNDMAIRIKQVYEERMLKIKKENEEKERLRLEAEAAAKAKAAEDEKTKEETLPAAPLEPPATAVE